MHQSQAIKERPLCGLCMSSDFSGQLEKAGSGRAPRFSRAVEECRNCACLLGLVGQLGSTGAGRLPAGAGEGGWQALHACRLEPSSPRSHELGGAVGSWKSEGEGSNGTG